MSAALTVPKLPVTKLDAALRQLDAAIEMFLEGRDEVAVHTLASAAEMLLGDIAKHRKVLRIIDLVKPERQKDLLRKFREAQNFFKHGQDDPDGILSFAPSQTLFKLFEAILHTIMLGIPASPEREVYWCWFACTYPDTVHWDKAPEEMRRLRDIIDDLLDPLDAMNLKPFLELLRQRRTVR